MKLVDSFDRLLVASTFVIIGSVALFVITQLF